VSTVYTIQADIVDLPMPLDPVRRYHGDSWTLQLQLNDSATTAHDLTGAVVAAAARNAVSGTVTAMVTAKGADPTAGAVTVTPPAGDLTPGVYTYDVQLTEGAAITTWCRGQLEVEGDITTP
jgi:hypothetical protein